jgi:hypothetical protein
MLKIYHHTIKKRVFRGSPSIITIRFVCHAIWARYAWSYSSSIITIRSKYHAIWAFHHLWFYMEDLRPLFNLTVMLPIISHVLLSLRILDSLILTRYIFFYLSNQLLLHHATFVQVETNNTQLINEESKLMMGKLLKIESWPCILTGKIITW